MRTAGMIRCEWIKRDGERCWHTPQDVQVEGPYRGLHLCWQHLRVEANALRAEALSKELHDERRI